MGSSVSAAVAVFAREMWPMNAPWRDGYGLGGLCPYCARCMLVEKIDVCLRKVFGMNSGHRLLFT